MQEYLHTYPQLVAQFASLFSLEWTPAIYVWATFFWYALIAVMLYWIAVRDKNLYRIRLVLPLSLFVIPHSGEVFLNLTGVQWFGAGLLPLFILQKPIVTYAQLLLLIPIICLIALTGPFFAFALPLLIFRMIRHRKSATLDSILFLFATAAALAQVLVMVTSYTFTSDSSPGALAFAHLIVVQTLPPLFLKKKILKLFGVAAVVFANVFTSGFLTAGVTAGRSYLRWLTAIASLLGLALLFAGAVKNVKDIALLNPFGDGGRYFIPLYTWWLQLAVVLCIAIRWRRFIGVVAICLILLSAAARWQSLVNMPDLAWRDHVARLATEDSVEIPINPQGWKITLHAADKR